MTTIGCFCPREAECGVSFRKIFSNRCTAFSYEIRETMGLFKGLSTVFQVEIRLFLYNLQKLGGGVFFKKFVVVEISFLEKTLDVSQFLWHN